MKHVTLLLAALPLFATPLFAAESVDPLPPLEIGGMKVRAAIETMPLFVEALERGFPLVTDARDEKEKGKDAAKPKPAEDSNEASKILANLAKAQTDMNEALKKNLAEIKKRRDERLADKPVVAEKPAEVKPAEPAKPIPAEAWSDKSWQNFCECAKKSVPVLRAKRRAELSADKTVPLQLESLLTAERGDGKTVAAVEGIACGKHLGPLGTTLADRNLELLFLTTLTKPSSPERFAPLWSAYRVWHWTQKMGEKAKANHFWDYVIQRNALRHLFSSEALPSLERHMKEYLAIYKTRATAKAEKGNFTIEISEKSFREAVDADIKGAAGVKYEATPCDKE